MPQQPRAMGAAARQFGARHIGGTGLISVDPGRAGDVRQRGQRRAHVALFGDQTVKRRRADPAGTNETKPVDRVFAQGCGVGCG